MASVPVGNQYDPQMVSPKLPRRNVTVVHSRDQMMYDRQYVTAIKLYKEILRNNDVLSKYLSKYIAAAILTKNI